MSPSVHGVVVVVVVCRFVVSIVVRLEWSTGIGSSDLEHTMIVDDAIGPSVRIRHQRHKRNQLASESIRYRYVVHPI